jgi:septum formation protein
MARDPIPSVEKPMGDRTSPGTIRPGPADLPAEGDGPDRPDRGGRAALDATEPWRLRPLVLASASPRRRLLLEEAGYRFEVDPSGVEEPEPSGPVDPAAYAAALAWRKAAEVARRRRDGLILAADTVCAVGGTILNKPSDRADAERMIRLQEGRDTEVLTGLCLYRAEASRWVGAIESSVVRFRPLSDAEREAHLDSGKWRDKAGAYGVQDDDPFVSVVAGSWSNVVGLPMECLAALLRDYPALWR